ncbi:antimicrobial peptide ABC transporter permease protein [Ligilactobacillus salitolerans]|uniref:Putative hemin transport system permease protein HrtB n=1 Tax=Ligilactobacillus salitolerans TaxID=1808352 RepID=A0A401IQ14_9LACO|nr:ABC transporter permease [Ligilactobacillus salitolerans]GBG93600.1 antimicrobial peptide ABC transporter permease protein [Ligilactobacillus salitolerans]
MFLALKEIKKEKFRSGLVIVMIVLIGYLIFILTSLALGLARENTAAINSWGINKVALNVNSNVDMRQSLVTKKQAGQLTDKEAYLGETSVVAKNAAKKKISAVFVGLEEKQFIARNLKISQGHKVNGPHELVVDSSLKDKGFKLNSTLYLNGSTTPYKIVGFVENAKLNIAPVFYGQLDTWKALRGIGTQGAGPTASAVVSKNAKYDNDQTGVQTYTKQQIINKLPGYTAQNSTFVMMIAFLMVISLVIIAVFLYILTMQKLPNYAVLRAQGIPGKVLAGATISQSFLLVVSGVLAGGLLTALTAVLMPVTVPMSFDVPILVSAGVGLLVMGLLGSLVSLKSVLNVDPVKVIGG